MEEKELSFEKAMNRLQEITEKIQKAEISLDESLALFEEGIKLSKYCSDKLESYQDKLNELTNKVQENA